MPLPSPVWSPELELAACLARVRPTPAELDRAKALVESGVRWRRFVLLVRHHRVVPLVASHLDRVASDRVPGGVRTALHGFRDDIARSNLRRYAEWIRLGRLFEERGIECVTLKGFPVALEVYGDPGRRRVGDLDLLVGEEDVAPTLALLTTEGFRLREGGSPRSLDLDRLRSSRPGVVLRGTDGTEVDLHWRIEWTRGVVALRAERILASRRELRVGGARLQVPGSGEAFVVLLAHTYGSRLVRLYSVVDVEEFLASRSPAEVSTALDAIEEHGAGAFLAAARRVAGSLWPARPSPRPSPRPAAGAPAGEEGLEGLVAHAVATLAIHNPAAPVEERGWSRVRKEIQVRRRLGASPGQAAQPLLGLVQDLARRAREWLSFG